MDAEVEEVQLEAVRVVAAGEQGPWLAVEVVRCLVSDL